MNDKRIARAVKEYRDLEKRMPKGWKPNLSALARIHKVAKSSLWYALQK